MPEGLLDVKSLVTLAALVFLCQAIVSMTKEMRWTKKIPTLVYAWLMGAVLVILGQLANNPQAARDWRTYLLGVLNGVVVAFTAGKSNDVALMEASKKQGTDAGM